MCVWCQGSLPGTIAGTDNVKSDLHFPRGQQFSKTDGGGLIKLIVGKSVTDLQLVYVFEYMYHF